MDRENEFISCWLRRLSQKIEREKVNEEELCAIKEFILCYSLRKGTTREYVNTMFLGFWIKKLLTEK